MSDLVGGWAMVLRVAVSVVVFAVLVFCGVGLLPWLRKMIAPDPTKEHPLTLRNRSNFPCAFEIEFNTSDPTLVGEVFWMGSPLPKAREARVIETEVSTPVEPSTKTVPVSGKPSGSGLAKAKSKLTLASPIIGILSGIGSFIPGSVGASLKASADSMRKTQMDARIALDAPDMAKKRVSAIGAQSEKLTGRSAAPETRAVAAADGVSTSSAQTTQPGVQGGKNKPTSIVEEGAEIPNRFVSKVVGEGDEISLSLRLRWAKIERDAFSKVYNLRVVQKPIGLELTAPPTDGHEGFAAFSGIGLSSILAARFAQVSSLLVLAAAQAGALFWIWIA